MRLFKSERIDLLARSHGYFPAAFRWRGRRFDVVTVEQCWSGRGPAAQRLFRVHCDAGNFVLEQCLASDVWRVTRWPLACFLFQPQPTRPARFPLPRSQRRPAQLARTSQPRQLAAPAARTALAPAERSTPWTAATQRG